MLLRSLGAMYGFRGTDWAAYGWAVAGVPVNDCTAGSRGSDGIGTAGVAAANAANGAAHGEQGSHDERGTAGALSSA